MIGDTTFDMEMARNAGIAGIAVAWGYHPAPELLAAGATALVERYDQLPRLLTRR
jgi:phosphoglycolate phosphatase